MGIHLLVFGIQWSSHVLDDTNTNNIGKNDIISRRTVSMFFRYTAVITWFSKKTTETKILLSKRISPLQSCIRE